MTPDDQQPGMMDSGRLRDHEVAEQLAAADAVLIALGRSSSDAGAVLATVADSAQRLCRCQGSRSTFAARRRVRARRGGRPVARVRALHHPAPDPTGPRQHGGPRRPDRRIHQVTDVLTDPGYGRRDLQEIALVTGP